MSAEIILFPSICLSCCANCGEDIAMGATIKQTKDGRWRHAEKCGPELEDMKVRSSKRKK
ncbi:hypothetical protein [Hyphomicrobium sp.]|uniref:hypothetical protein n=1 Tax=Hyphomicrobium sp. TaxID=82 RepID=UPI001D3788DA|nr:hypothetical protein [Hyphomicrobium sp.]MBY0562455.1 hypothetical protein [Hyphomicrobium sp.]